MRWLAPARLAFLLSLAGCAIAQAPDASPSPSPSNGDPGPTASSNASASAAPTGNADGNGTSSSSDSVRVVATTITSIIPGPSGNTTAIIPLTVTIPINNVTTFPNGSVDLNGTLGINGTDGLNGTNITAPIIWNDTLGWLPFTPHLDPAFGIGGGLMILSGIPVAILGGKARWSSLAIVSGYSVATFCLIIILSFGVTPALLPPSPDPPSTAMRGLYLLAVGVSFLIGGGLGVFFYTFARYWVGAVGGFCFGWYLLNTRKGGLVTNIGGRWAIIGGFTLGAIVCTLTPRLQEILLLGASAWIGATAFTLGVDCFTRAGLKEFYIYNLGYRDIFPALKGQKFPLTQSMQVELGVLAAAAIIAGAIQFKVVSVLKKRREALRDEEQARKEAEDIDRAAENFKNVDAELAEWEGKHTESSNATLSKGGCSSSIIPPPTLDYKRTSTPTLAGSGRKEVLSDSPEHVPPLYHPVPTRRMSLLEEVGSRDGDDVARTPTSPSPCDPELESKLQLLAEVRRARQSIRSSMDKLRSADNTPTPRTSLHEATPPLLLERSTSSTGSNRRSRLNSGASSHLLDDGPVRRSSVALDDSVHDRRPSTASGKLLYDPVGERERRTSATSSRLLDETLRERERRISASSSRLLDDMGHERRGSAASSRLLDDVARSRHDSVYSRSPLSPHTPELQNRLSLADDPRRHSVIDGEVIDPPNAMRRPSADAGTQPNTEWDEYLATRNVITPAAPTAPRDVVVSDGVARALTKRDERTSSFIQAPELKPGQEYGQSLARAFDEEAKAAKQEKAARRRASGEAGPNRRVSKTMTTDELADRHRDALSRIQDRATAPMREQEAITAAREHYSAQQRAEREREAQRRREREQQPQQSQRHQERRTSQQQQPTSTPLQPQLSPTKPPPTKLPRHERGDTARGTSPVIAEQLADRTPPRTSDRARRTEEWRQSLPLQVRVQSPTPPSARSRHMQAAAATSPTRQPPVRRASRTNVNIA